MDKQDIVKTLKQHKDSLIEGSGESLDDGTLGFLHGLEYALSLLEDRPVIYIKRDKTYHEHDIQRFPEYFL